MKNSTFPFVEELLKKHLPLFPIKPNTKDQPLVKGWQKLATTDLVVLKQWWKRTPDANIGIACGHYEDSKWLLGVDLDMKEGKDGLADRLELELSGKDFPSTFEQTTVSHGAHMVYWSEVPIKNSVTKIAPGIDIRGMGGYLIGAGSKYNGGIYTSNYANIVKAPAWLVELCKRQEVTPTTVQIHFDINSKTASQRANFYLEKEAPLAIQGAGGDHTTFTVAAKLKDIGLEQSDALEALLEKWNDRCQPPWLPDELARKVEHAFQYGKKPRGADAPEAHFTPIEESCAVTTGNEKQDSKTQHPIEIFNKEFCFVVTGTSHCVVWETKDENGNEILQYLKEDTFHKLFLNKTMIFEGAKKPAQLTRIWMSSDNRRTYKGVCFKPGKPTQHGYLNLFRGFPVKPLPPEEVASEEAKRSLEMFLEHITENICLGNTEHARWVIGYFAHLFQKPWQKPHTALVFKGSKGVGKNAVLDRIGHLVGRYYLETSKKRHLAGNFNAHLENKLLLNFNEAFWSGDYEADSILKDLITGNTHVIERKGQEAIVVDNCARICIIGNAEWMVPAGPEERRYAVFAVGEKRMRDNAFFSAIQRGMEAGGYELLMRYLLEFDLKDVDVNVAPNTEGLLDQKLQGLNSLEAWWYQCLKSERILGVGSSDGWPIEIEKKTLRDAYLRWMREEQMTQRPLQDYALGKNLKKAFPSVDAAGKKRVAAVLVNMYRFPDLSVARSDFEKYLGSKIEWEQ